MTSLFRQPCERVAFLTYFLGAVVPLAALGVLSGAVAPRLLAGVAVSWPAFVIAVAGLSMGSFLALRRVVWASRARRLSDRQRFLALVGMSASLSDLEDEQAAAGAAARHGLALVGATSCLVLWRDGAGRDLRVLGLAGSTLCLDDAELLALLRQAGGEALARGTCVRRAPARGRPTGVSALPLQAGGGAGGSLVVLTPPGRGLSPEELDALAMLAGVSSVALAAARAHAATPVPALA